MRTRWTATCVALAVMTVVGVDVQPAFARSGPILTRAQQVRQLSPDQVMGGYRAQIRGVVTYYDAVGPNLFVQDATGGIWVDLRGRKDHPNVGTLIEVAGIVEQGFSPYIAKPTWKVVGSASMPKPRRVTYADFVTSADDGQWVQMEGVVRSFVKEAAENVLVIDVATAGGVFKARIPNHEGHFPMHLVDATVRFRGVCGASFNRHGQLIGVHLFVSSLDHLTVIEAAPSDPFAVPVRPITGLGRFSAKGAPLHRVKVQGFVTAVMPGRGLFIKDNTGGLYVQTHDGGFVAPGVAVGPGDEIETVGFPVTGAYTPMLRSARFRPTLRRQELTPVRLTAEQAIFGRHDAQLIEIEGTVQSDRLTPSGTRDLTLEDNGTIFHAVLQAAGARSPLPMGSRVLLTGVCSIAVDENGNPAGFRLLLRSPQDIAVLATPPWWTATRMLSLLGVAAIIIAAALAWVFVLRRRVSEQTAIILKQHERSISLIENSPYGIASLDEQEYLLGANSTFRTMAGIGPAEEITKLRVQDVLRFEDESAQKFAARLREGGTFQNLQTACHRRDGRRITVRFAGRVFFDETQRARLVELVAEDITAKLQLEQQLHQAHKLEAVGRLAGGVAHDFNNLLLIIKGYTSMLAEKLGLETEDGRKLHAIDEASRRAAELTHQLLAYSRQQVLEPKVMEIDPVVRDLEKMLRRLIREDIDFRIELGARGACIKVDPNRLEQSLINLAVNAQDAMTAGGKLLIQTQRITVGQLDPSSASVPTGEYVLICVSDTGSGMDRETQEHIFEPFFTTKKLGKGTGLGLSTVYGIVKQSGGSINVDSVPGEGTTFRVYLPVVEQPVTLEAAKAAEPPPRGKGVVLIVEDEDEVRKLLCETLTRLGYRTVEAKNGEQALELAHTTSRVDIVVCDMVMPRMGGIELRDTLKRLKPELPVLLMSGYSDVAPDIGELIGKGTQFLQKPFSPKELGQKVHEMLTVGAAKAHSAVN